MPLLDGHAHDNAATGFNNVATDNGIVGPVCTLHEHIWLQRANNVGWRILVEDHDHIDSRERRNDLGAVDSRY